MSLAAPNQIMTQSFPFIQHNQLATLAVNLMEQSKVSALSVLKGKGKLIGIINMRQFLQVGIV